MKYLELTPYKAEYPETDKKIASQTADKKHRFTFLRLWFDKYKNGQKRKMIWYFAGFLVLKAVLTALIFNAPRVLELIRTINQDKI
jgi:hypothetical protein